MHYEAAVAHRDNMSLRAQLLAVEQQLFRARQRHQQEVRSAPVELVCICIVLLSLFCALMCRF